MIFENLGGGAAGGGGEERRFDGRCFRRNTISYEVVITRHYRTITRSKASLLCLIHTNCNEAKLMRIRKQFKALVVAFPLAGLLQTAASASIYNNNYHSTETDGFRLSTKWGREKIGRDYDSVNVTTAHLDKPFSSAKTYNGDSPQTVNVTAHLDKPLSSAKAYNGDSPHTVNVTAYLDKPLSSAKAYTSNGHSVNVTAHLDKTLSSAKAYTSRGDSPKHHQLLGAGNDDEIGRQNTAPKRNIARQNPTKVSYPKHESDMNVKPARISIPRPFKHITTRNSIGTNTNLNTSRVPLKYEIDRRIDRGRITWDFGTQQSQSYAKSQSLRHRHAGVPIPFDAGKQIASDQHKQFEQTKQDLKEQGKIRLSMDSLALSRLIPVLLFAFSSLFSATFGTLRILAPLVISKQIIVSIGKLVSDWYTGRYFRKTYSRLENIYLHYYETPATFRALSRTLSQWIVYLALARIMGWMVGITHPPCRSEGRGLAFFCGLLWMGSVVGLGHAFAEAVALWGGPMRLQAAQHPAKTRWWKVVIRPWQILQWMQNPEEWIRLVAQPERRPFDPNPLLYPATWIPLRLLQMVSVAKVAATEPDEYLWCSGEVDQIPSLMRKYLFQLALSDEWVRVFLRERRVGLGIVVGVAYYFAMLSLLVTSAMINGKATVLMVPSLIANIISTWMNVVIFWNRYETKRNARKNRTTSRRNENLVWL